MERNLLILLTLITFSLTTQAQMPTASIDKTTLQTETKKEIKTQNSNKLYFLSRESFPLDEAGILYLDRDFRNGSILDFENEEIEVDIRYRIADDEMQILHLGSEKALYPSKVKQVSVSSSKGEITFVPAEYEAKRNKTIGYFELLSDGKIRLLKTHRKSGKNKVKCSYYIQKEGEIAKPFKPRKYAILKAYKNLNSEAKSFINSNHLNINKEKDLVKLFDYLNSK